MPEVVVLPHPEICPDGAAFDVPSGTSICDALLAHGIEIEHACEKSCACTTCHVIVREGLPSLRGSTERIERVLTAAVGLVRRRPPLGIAPGDIDCFIARHVAQLRTMIGDFLSRRTP